MMPAMKENKRYYILFYSILVVKSDDKYVEK